MVAESGDDSEVGGVHTLSSSHYGSNDAGQSMHKLVAHNVLNLHGRNKYEGFPAWQLSILFVHDDIHNCDIIHEACTVARRIVTSNCSCYHAHVYLKSRNWLHEG